MPPYQTMRTSGMAAPRAVAGAAARAAAQARAGGADGAVAPRRGSRAVRRVNRTVACVLAVVVHLYWTAMTRVVRERIL